MGGEKHKQIVQTGERKKKRIKEADFAGGCGNAEPPSERPNLARDSRESFSFCRSSCTFLFERKEKQNKTTKIKTTLSTNESEGRSRKKGDRPSLSTPQRVN